MIETSEPTTGSGLSALLESEIFRDQALLEASFGLLLFVLILLALLCHWPSRDYDDDDEDDWP